jgi:hypothetical protein
MRSRDGSADPAEATAVAAQALEILTAVRQEQAIGALTAQQQRELMRLIDALADLLGEVPDNV